MRTLMLEVDRQDYLKTAKAKGLGPVRIVVFHQIRNAIIPMITNLGTCLLYTSSHNPSR